MKKCLLLTALALLLLGISPVSADDAFEKVESPIIARPIDKTLSQLIQISKRKLLVQKELIGLEKRTPSKEVISRIGYLQTELDNLDENYESLATQIPKGEILKDQTTQKGWLDELYEITQPVVSSLKDLTERPRKIDALKTKIAGLKSRITVYEDARRNILDLERFALEASAVAKEDKGQPISASEVQQKFREDLVRLKDRYNAEILLVELEGAQRALKDLQASEKGLFTLVAEATGEFMRVRGRNLIVALGVFWGFGWILTLAYKGIESKTRLLEKVKRPTRKLIKVAYLLIIFLIAFLASLFSLYLVDDWLLLSLFFLVLMAIGWTSRQFVPKFLRELKMILNLGTVREGERIFYEGLPWLIKEIGLHVTLNNPRLDGGTLRVPVGKLMELSSRPFVKTEEWFPTSLGDWVLLEDNVFGEVVSQTPEQVILKYKDSRKFYSVSEFLSLKPLNLSTGYLIVVKFGLDYAIQNRICDEIPNLFQSTLKEKFRDKLGSQSPTFKSLEVYFDTAGDSSLGLVILASVNGGHAGEYYSLKRDIQKALVAICNAEGLTIPFSQLVLTMAEDTPPASLNAMETRQK